MASVQELKTYVGKSIKGAPLCLIIAPDGRSARAALNKWLRGEFKQKDLPGKVRGMIIADSGTTVLYTPGWGKEVFRL